MAAVAVNENGATILTGDSREVLKTLPSGSVHCCISSPPYWGLRSYVDHGSALKSSEIGLEPTFEAHLTSLLEVFAEVWRVLRDDATLWCNYGDSYNSQGGHTGQGQSSQRQGRANVAAQHAVKGNQVSGLKPKDLIGMPWRVAFALQEAGWYLRSAITVCKLNPMPESVTDRPTNATEMLFLLTKQPIYFYDAAAVREPSSGRKGGRFGSYPGSTFRKDAGRERPPDDGTRNLRNWITLVSQPLKEAHFAAFSEKLVEPCILAGTSEWGCCGECGAPWRRVVEKGAPCPEPAGNMGFRASRLSGQEMTRWRAEHPDTTSGWQPACECEGAPVVPCVCLDPFAGSGTVSRVATRLGRRSIAIDLNPEYTAMARERNAQLGLML
jgi:DNA modification methylase